MLKDERDFFEFMLAASRETLDGAMLAKRAEEANLRKQAMETLDLWLDAAAKADLLAWFSAHREEVTARLTAPVNPFMLPKSVNRISRKGEWRKRA